MPFTAFNRNEPLEPFSFTAVSLGMFVALGIMGRGLRKKSLSKTGAAAAWFVGFAMVSTGLRGFVLLMFYQVSVRIRFVEVELCTIYCTGL